MDLKPSPLCGQCIHHALRCGKAKGGPARKDKGIDARHRLVRFQQVGIARPRCAAHDRIACCHRAVFGQKDGCAGFEHVILRVSDGKTGDIGDQVAGTGFHSAGAPRLEPSE